jgi:hypothetical protein
MKQFQERLLDIYNRIITELDQINSDHETFLSEAEKTKDVSQEIVIERMALARDNQRRLQIAKTEKELIERYNFQ